MASAGTTADDRLTWKKASVQGRRAVYGIAGSGPTVVFLHGWALGHHSYKRALRRLARRGSQVVTPALPGFGGTADLPATDRTIAGYGAWVAAFMVELQLDAPAVVVGHSFGGGVGIALAHDHPDLVRQLVLVNSVGGVVDRSLWEWGVHFARDLTPGRHTLQTALAMREDLVPNLLRNPRALWDVGGLARTADLRRELAELQQRALPVLVVSGREDSVIPVTAFDAICAALGTEGTLLPGNHLWLLADPDAFDEVMANVLVPIHAGTDPRSELRVLLEATTIPADLADALVRDAPALWLASDQVAVLGADLALCHPALGEDEVRARISTSSLDWRLTVVAQDRPGLLADTARTLAGEGFSIAAASVASWDDHDLALHSISVLGPPPKASVLRRLGDQLRSRPTGPRPVATAFAPRGPATVAKSGTANGDALISVTAPDQPGLLWAVCRWFADRDASIQAAWVSGGPDLVNDVFVVRGDVDVAALERFLN
jgi:pimeloyl-ACP methyl ester carboxylesterase/predicted amino acid-binding ACT domain protein